MNKQLKIWVFLIVSIASSFTLADPAPTLLYKVTSNLCLAPTGGLALGDSGFFMLELVTPLEAPVAQPLA